MTYFLVLDLVWVKDLDLGLDLVLVWVKDLDLVLVLD